VKRWLVFALLLGACGTPQEDLRRRLLRSWTERTILPLYAELETRCQELEARSSELCASSSDERLTATREAWWAARAPLKQAEHFGFGPYAEEPLRYGPELDFWPVRPANIDETLAGDAALDAGTLGASKKGLPVVEYLLYVDVDSDLEAAFAAGGRRCQYLGVVASDLPVQARLLREAWEPSQGNFSGELVDAGQGSTRYDTLDLAVGEMVNRLGFIVENMRTDKLEKPLGIGSGGTPQPDKAESQFSARSLEDLRDNLRGVERSFFGTNGGKDEVSLEEYLRSRGHELGPLLRLRLDACQAAIDAIELPLTEAISQDAAAVELVLTELEALQRTIQVDVIGALALSVSFNDNDGD
jgi:predicted lipoprotein